MNYRGSFDYFDFSEVNTYPISERSNKVALEDLDVRVEPRREPGQPRYASYVITVITSTPEDAIAPVVELASRYCWVTNTLHSMPGITYQLEAGAG